jgi:glycosyltransferase involved in cell wall biosynthesis
MPNPGLERLAIICSHPVQYYAPLFRLMAQSHEIKVFYKTQPQYDPGFCRNVNWDLPLLDGYNHIFSHNLAEIKRYQPTSILIYGWAHVSHLKIIAYFSNKATLYFRGDSTLLDPTPLWRKMIKKLLLKQIYRQFEYALYVGKHNKLYFEEYGFKSEQLIYAPHAVDNQRFPVNNQCFAADHQDGATSLGEAVGIRTTLGIADQDLLVLYTGKFTLKKNPEILLHAFAEIKQPGVHLLFVGSGQLEQQLKSMAQQIKAVKPQSNIHFMTFQNQQRMPAIYQSCDLFCMPSSGPAETWGLAINEAMAAGKPVLASSMAGAAADLIDNSNGRTFKAGDQDDLLAKLTELLADKAQLRNMGRASSEKIKNWSYQHQIQAIYGT